MTHLTYADISDILSYDPDSGKLFWKPRDRHMFTADRHWKMWNSRFAGKEALTAISGHGYRHGPIFGQSYLAHRVAWALFHKAWPDGQIDHINGDRTNNRMENLRDIPASENQKNMKMPKNNKSGVCGVNWYAAGRKWRAEIGVGGTGLFLGYFDTVEAAAEARKEADRLHGFHHNHGRKAA